MERSIQTLDMNDCENCSSLHSRRSSNTRARDRAMRHGRVCARASHTARSHPPSLEHLLHRLELIRQFSSTGNLSHTDGLLPVLCFSNKQHQRKIVTTALNNSTGNQCQRREKSASSAGRRYRHSPTKCKGKQGTRTLKRV